jgi:uncharacterized protein (TIGR02001 family)
MSASMTGRSGRPSRVCALIALAAGAWVASPVPAQPAPDPLHGSVTLASHYVLNGLSQTAGDPSLRLALDYEHGSGFFAGGILANVDFKAEAQFAAPRDTQFALYTGYVWRKGDWMSNLTLTRYFYPDITIDYDYTQVAVNLSYRERFFLTAARSSSYLSVYGTAEQYSAGLAQPLSGQFELGASAGRFSSDGLFDVSYSFWDVGVSRPLGRIGLDLRYHANSYARSSLLGNDASGLWVLSMSYTFLPSRN